MAEFDAAKEATLLCARHHPARRTSTAVGSAPVPPCGCAYAREVLERAYAAGHRAAREDAFSRLAKLVCKNCRLGRSDEDGVPYNHTTCRRIEKVARQIRAMLPAKEGE